jgi:prepilin-type N-terminal cleavage/methylation domain-containing protein
MNTKHKKSGFSLIELMVAAMAFGILAVAVGTTLYFGWLGWRINSESVEMQRNASLVMRLIEKAVQHSEPDDLPNAKGSILSLSANTRRNNGESEAFEISENDLVYKENGTVTMTLVRGFLSSFTITPILDESLYIELVQSSTEGRETHTSTMIVSTRNR